MSGAVAATNSLRVQSYPLKTYGRILVSLYFFWSSCARFAAAAWSSVHSGHLRPCRSAHFWRRYSDQAPSLRYGASPGEKKRSCIR